MSSSAKIYLVTGASRGIGFGLVSTIVSKQPNAIVYATARDPVKATALQALASKFPNQVKVAKYVTSDADGTRALAQEIGDTHGHVDVVVANAGGIFSHEGAAVDTPADALREHLEINAIAILVLFQAFAPLLQKSASPKFIPITSSSGSLTSFIDAPTLFLAYGVSKAALNYIARKIHFENTSRASLAARTSSSAIWAAHSAFSAVFVAVQASRSDAMACSRVAPLSMKVVLTAAKISRL